MTLCKFKKNKNFHATKIFTNREEPRKSFWKLFNKVYEGEISFQVLSYYGIGGIGKTKLLKELNNELNQKKFKEKSVNTVFVSLDAYEFDSPIDILISIRNQLGFSCILFDYALIVYWLKTGYTEQEITKKLSNKNDDLLELAQTLVDFSGFSAPVNLIEKTYKSLKRKYYSYFGRYKSEFNQIKELESREIFDRLPYYLGLSIEHSCQNNNVFICMFIDAYETMLYKFDVKSITNSSEIWLKDLIGSSESGLYVIGSREYLKWVDHNKEWDNYLEQHSLGTLDHSDANYFLKGVPIKDKSIREMIIQTSSGLPLYLDLCVDIYESKIEDEKEIKKEDFNIPANKVVERFLRHLSKDERELVKVFSFTKYFDFNFFKYMVKSFNINFPFTLFEEFVNRSFVNLIDEDKKIYKINEEIREHILKNINFELKIEIIENMLRYFYDNKKQYQFEILIKYFATILNLIEYNMKIDDQLIKHILNIGLYLIDNGYWIEVGKITQKVMDNNNLNNEFIPSIKLLNIIYLRKTGQLENGLKMINNLNISKDLLGDYYLIAEFNKANFTRLLGNYNQAEKYYENLVNKINSKVDFDKSNEIKIKRQWSDILFLKGKFKKALNILNELNNSKNCVNKLNKAENLRVIGHIQRFNLNLRKAHSLYCEALKISKELNAVGLEGKLYNNMVETFCWSNPKKAIKYSKKSLELNNKLNSYIELGKTFAALGIAYTNNGNFEKAQDNITKAISYQQKTGYQSGILFAKLAQFLLDIKYNDKTKFKNTLNDIENLTNKLDVYHYLKIPIYIYQNNDKKINIYKNKFQWLNFEHTKNEYKKILKA